MALCVEGGGIWVRVDALRFLHSSLLSASCDQGPSESLTEAVGTLCDGGTGAIGVGVGGLRFLHSSLLLSCDQGSLAWLTDADGILCGGGEAPFG